VVIQNSPFVIAKQDSVKVTPFSCCDGQMEKATAGGQTVWRVLPGSSYMYFQIPYTWNFKPGSPAYLQITYFDEGYGTVWVEYDSAFGIVSRRYRRSDTHSLPGEFARCGSYRELLAEIRRASERECGFSSESVDGSDRSALRQGRDDLE
jgi:hypothetical protein